MENSMEIPQKIKIRDRTTIWSSIPLLGIHSKSTKTLIWKDICTPMITVALFTIAKIWKQPTYLWMDEWIRRSSHTYTHNGILLGHKKEQNPAICENMGGPRWYYIKWGMSDEERQIQYDIAPMRSLKKQMNRKFSGGPGIRTPLFQPKGQVFNHWLGN